MRIRLDCIAPLACNRPNDVRRHVAMLRAGKTAPAIWLIKQQRGSKYRYRIFDGAHRLRAHIKVATSTSPRKSGRHGIALMPNGKRGNGVSSHPSRNS